VDSLDQVADRIRHFMDVKSPQGFLDKVKMASMLAEMGSSSPKTVSTGSCKEVIKRDHLSVLDFSRPQCWPKDAGRFITMPCVITRDPKTGKRNVGMYRMQVYDEHTTACIGSGRKSEQSTIAKPCEPRCLASGLIMPAKAAVDIMARTSGGSVLVEGDRPSGRMEVAVAIAPIPPSHSLPSFQRPPDVEEYLIAGFLRQKPVELVKWRDG